MTRSKNQPPGSTAPVEPGQPQYADRAYRSRAGIVGGVLLLALAGWIGGDAVARGTGRTPWLALAALLLAVPLIVAFTLRPAVFANDDEIRVRNPFRTITLLWGGVDALRARYSTELLAGDRKFQLWAIPVSIRGRKRAARQTVRAQDPNRRDPFGLGNVPRRPPAGIAEDGTIRSWGDQALAELRELNERHDTEEASKAARARRKAEQEGGPEAVAALDAQVTERPEPSVRWAYEVIGPAVAGLVVLVILLATG
ncbi:PH domain-containing protein [Actinacidiphila yeochonensis]|uniref:PH domain-containing protein n=1 Tax=Actinacidiphila yeochonensis TaxID=89050 RepID=UPI000564C5EB|nr:PH domain-containing protein [Actinacidiphila yeochonensis]